MQNDPLVVGIFHAPPFTIEGEDGWDGIGVHLWRDAAEELEIRYEWRKIDPAEATSALRDGRVDLVVGMVATNDAEREIDFSHSYYTSSIGLARSSQRTILQILFAFFSPRFWRIALWLSLAFLVVGILAWLFEAVRRVSASCLRAYSSHCCRIAGCACDTPGQFSSCSMVAWPYHDT